MNLSRKPLAAAVALALASGFFSVSTLAETKISINVPLIDLDDFNTAGYDHVAINIAINKLEDSTRNGIDASVNINAGSIEYISNQDSFGPAVSFDSLVDVNNGVVVDAFGGIDNRGTIATAVGENIVNVDYRYNTKDLTNTIAPSAVGAMANQTHFVVHADETETVTGTLNGREIDSTNVTGLNTSVGTIAAGTQVTVTGTVAGGTVTGTVVGDLTLPANTVNNTGLSGTGDVANNFIGGIIGNKNNINVTDFRNSTDLTFDGTGTTATVNTAATEVTVTGAITAAVDVDNAVYTFGVGGGNVIETIFTETYTIENIGPSDSLAYNVAYNYENINASVNINLGAFDGMDEVGGIGSFYGENMNIAPSAIGAIAIQNATAIGMAAAAPEVAPLVPEVPAAPL